MTRDEAKTINNMVGSISLAFNKKFPIQRVVENNKHLRQFRDEMLKIRQEVADFLVENIEE